MRVQTANRINTINEYYFSKKLQEIALLNTGEEKVINLGIGSPDLAPDASVIHSLNESSKVVSNHAYQSYKGIPELRTAIATWYKNIYQINIDSSKEILPLMGSKEGIMHISMTYINNDDEVLVPNPGYPSYTSATNLAGGKVVNYNLKEEKGWDIDIQEIEKLITSKTKLMWVNYPNMPIGTAGNYETLKKLIDLATANNIIVCNDNPYSLTLNDNPRSLLELDPLKKCVIELNSLSKSHSMAGWRLGMMVANEARINEVLKFKSNMDSGMFLPIQHAAITALSVDKKWYKQNNDTYKERRKKAWELLSILNCKYDKNQVGMFVWARIPKIMTEANSFSDLILYNTKVFITPGSIFGSNGDKYIRVSLCSSNEILEKAIIRIKKFIKQ
ncbi:MAG: aminotransferase class I/II-fold pyridoxal phosphate-dependent enzyme [Flavobacteriales bacterium]|nr:aminotransferase class I/II-fold pyridoxal phosphate-dependent enzyme [Flavobacteriales bacterium]MCB9363378.1 aminotransferase class I/II-fold pyridoxal phosphate-dependent enzyme [Flavobacteriales bacterium]